MGDDIINRPANFNEVMSWLGKHKSPKKKAAARQNAKLPRKKRKETTDV